jgi:hypothetical protein
MMLKCVVGGAIMLTVGACAVVESSFVMTDAGQRCDSALGSYSLPKTHLRVKVEGNSRDPLTAATAMTLIEEVSVADPRRVYCLDHLSSPTAKDTIKVFRGASTATAPPPLQRSAQASTQLLNFVSSNTIDYTADIIRKFIRSAFILVSGKPDFKPVAARALKDQDQLYPMADYTFDPFDLVQMDRVNSALSPLGFCLVLEGAVSFEGVAPDPVQLCAQRGQSVVLSRYASAYAAYESAPDGPARVQGILYRPRQAYRLFVYSKDDPKGSTAWRLARTATVRLENISPVISLGISRAIFAARRTALLFDRGALVGLCVSKKSELQAAVEIPLEVVRSIVALPTEILLVRIDEVKGQQQLLEVETQVIAMQKQLIAFLADPTKQKPTYSGTPGAIGAARPGAAVFDPDFLSEATRAASESEFSQVCAEPGSKPGGGT